MRKFNMNFVFHFYILGLMSWIWTDPSTEGLKFVSPSKMKLIWGLQSWPLETSLATQKLGFLKSKCLVPYMANACRIPTFGHPREETHAVQIMNSVGMNIVNIVGIFNPNAIWIVILILNIPRWTILPVNNAKRVTPPSIPSGNLNVRIVNEFSYLFGGGVHKI